jgi:hypothetical protein
MEAGLVFALWEAAEPAPGRAARMLALTGENAAGALSLGAAAGRLLALREATAGRRIAAVADCTACGLRHEVELDAAELRSPVAAAPLTVESGGWRALVRVPNLDDAAAAASCADVEEAAELLRAGCILALEGPDGDQPPPALFLAIEAALDEAEPLADARLALACTGCGAEWEVGFDPAGFFAAEIAWIGQRQVAEIAALARAYGWSEAEILAIPPARRRAYRALAG